jgi:hypothetical protein
LTWPGAHEQHPHAAVQPALHSGGAAQPAFAQFGGASAASGDDSAPPPQALAASSSTPSAVATIR